MDNSVDEFIESKGYIVGQSGSFKKIFEFDSTKEADLLFSFLKLHPSFRVVFNSLVKSEYLTLDDIINKGEKLLIHSETSYVYSGYCECGAILNTPNIVDYQYELPDGVQIQCNKCRGKISIGIVNYKPITRPTKNDLFKVLNHAILFELFEPANTLECINCVHLYEIPDTTKTNLICPKCENIMNVNTVYTPVKPLMEFIKDKQGYWLEWYIWRQLKDFHPEYGKEIKKDDEVLFDFDVSFLKEGRLIVIECKDTSDVRDLAVNLIEIEKIVNDLFL
jgi:hypothetical protein